MIIPENQAVGLFGGSFNPIHTGHIRVAEEALRGLRLSKVILIPSSISPHKAKPNGTPADIFRLNMCKIAVKNIPFLEVSGIETRRGGVSYTVDTLEALRSETDMPFWFITGSDMFLTIHTWRRATDIFRMCSVAVFPRRSGDMPEIDRQAEFLRDNYGLNSAVIDIAPIEISSSELRDMLKNRRGQEYLPAGVYDYICINGLYDVSSAAGDDEK